MPAASQRRAKWIMEPAKATATEMHWARKAMGIEGQSENSEDHEDISVHVEQSLH